MTSLTEDYTFGAKEPVTGVELLGRLHGERPWWRQWGWRVGLARDASTEQRDARQELVTGTVIESMMPPHPHPVGRPEVRIGYEDGAVSCRRGQLRQLPTGPRRQLRA